MSLCVTGVLGLATTIYNNIGNPTALSIGYISGWLTDPNNLGDLNNRLSTSFYLDSTAPAGPCIKDDFGPEECNVYNLMYVETYYESLAVAALVNGGTLWVSLSEGDTKVTRSDAVAVSKQFTALRDGASAGIAQAAHHYKLRLSVPQSVDGAQLDSYPTP
jgi:hypothetical protein